MTRQYEWAGNWSDEGTGPFPWATESDSTATSLIWRDKPEEWTAAIMSDDNLDPDSLVGKMLRPSADDVTWETPTEFRAKGARVSGANGEPIAEFVFDECTMKNGETYRLSYDEQTGTVRPELIADAMQFMDDYDSDLQAMADREKAEHEATVEPMPLWKVMHAGYWTEAGVDVADDFPPPVPECYAAEIEALRDWLLPEEPEPTPLFPKLGKNPADDIIYSQWAQRQRLRAMLTEQARIARGGQP